MMNLQDRFLAYLRAYEAKDLAAIAGMLADEPTLRDWKISVRGREALLAETRANFDGATSLQIEVLRLYAAEHGVAGELRVQVDGHIALYVTDVITFDAQGRIQAIRAYLGRGD